MQIDPSSEKMLIGVHPDLVKVVHEVFATCDVPFRVTYGVRTLAAERDMIARGVSSLKNPKLCRHVPTGTPPYGHAVDISILVDGQPSWANQYIPAYVKVRDHFQAASKKLGIPIRSGADWRTFKDWGHHELPAAQYP